MAEWPATLDTAGWTIMSVIERPLICPTNSDRGMWPCWPHLCEVGGSKRIASLGELEVWGCKTVRIFDPYQVCMVDKKVCAGCLCFVSRLLKNISHHSTLTFMVWTSVSTSWGWSEGIGMYSQLKSWVWTSAGLTGYLNWSSQKHWHHRMVYAWSFFCLHYISDLVN